MSERPDDDGAAPSPRSAPAGGERAAKARGTDRRPPLRARIAYRVTVTVVVTAYAAAYVVVPIVQLVGNGIRTGWDWGARVRWSDASSAARRPDGDARGPVPESSLTRV